MMQNRVFAVYFSMMRRRAICAADVMASASSRMINLKEARDDLPVVGGAIENICFVPARRLKSVCARTFSSIAGLLTRESLDLFSNNVNSSIVTCVEFQHHLSHVFGAIYPSG
jgi:hypothetical protein